MHRIISTVKYIAKMREKGIWKGIGSYLQIRNTCTPGWPCLPHKACEKEKKCVPNFHCPIILGAYLQVFLRFCRNLINTHAASNTAYVQVVFIVPVMFKTPQSFITHVLPQHNLWFGDYFLLSFYTPVFTVHTFTQCKIKKKKKKDNRK